VILRDVNLHVTAGQSVAIVGPSGSGKSTLLQILGTLDQPTAGEVRIDGRNPFALADLELAQFRNRTFGFVFQEHHLLPQLTVLENVLVPALASRAPTREQQDRAQDLLARVGLRERLHHRPAELSGGERQRVALARALLLRPPILLADEPTGNLDRTNAQGVGRLLGELQQAEKMTLIVVTHSAELASLMGRQMTINEGKLV
jgi:lipoprotein-releasing system ATP-binding protein